MLDKYFVCEADKVTGFRAVRFIRDYDVNRKMLDSVRDSLGEISEIKAISNQPKVQTSPRPDALERMVILRDHLIRQQNELEMYFRSYERWMSMLSEDDRLYLETMYQGYTMRPVAMLEEIFDLRQAQIYRNVKRALDRFTGLVLGK